MKDNWSNFNECVQNILALAVVAVYLFMTFKQMSPPIELAGFVAAILVYFGFKAYKK